MRKDLNLRMTVLVGIDTRVVGNGDIELRDLQVVKTLIVPCKLSDSGNIITEQEQWRQPTARYRPKDRVCRWGSQEWSRGAQWWAPTEMKVGESNATHPVQWRATWDYLVREGIISATDSYPDGTEWRVVIVLPEEIREHLLSLYVHIKGKSDAKKEAERREYKRKNYTHPTRKALSKAQFEFKSAKTEAEAATLGVVLFRARLAVAKSQKEAEVRWPSNLEKKAPGDAGVLGELALALAEEEAA